jgi:hypothetical protein
MEEIMSSGDAYTFRILEKWTEIIEMGEEFRVLFLRNEINVAVTFQYVSKLTRLWLELSPILKDRSDLEDLPARYAEYRTYYFDPRQLMKDPEKIFGLEEILREAIEKLKITQFER